MKLIPTQLAYRLSQRESRRNLTRLPETGRNVIAIQSDGRMATDLGPGTTRTAGSELVMIGTADQRAKFGARFG